MKIECTPQELKDLIKEKVDKTINESNRVGLVFKEEKTNQ